MKITIDNYESWFLDYMQEKLSSEEIKELLLFLSQHPDLEEELADFMPVLKPDNQLIFPGKEMLKRSIFDDPAHFETSAIAAIEGDLSPEEQIHFTKWLDKNPDQQKFVQEFGKCKLHPKLEIGFPAKAGLKKRTLTLAVWIRVAAAAAVLLIALLTFYPEDQVSNMATSIANKASQSDAKENTVKVENTEKSLTLTSSANTNNLRLMMKQAKLSPKRLNKAAKTMLVEARQKTVIQLLESKSSLVKSYIPDLTDLIPIKEQMPVYAASNEISLTEYLKNKFKALRASGSKEFITREEVTLAGLRLFSRLPGNHLTGKKGSDGRLTTISFNTHLLAFSIPINR
jgi:hypothetical protein